MSYFGLILWGIAEERRSLALTHALHLARVFVVGIMVGILITLLLEGSLNPFKKRSDDSVRGDETRRFRDSATDAESPK